MAVPSSATVLDAMKAMSEQGVSSVAVVEDPSLLASAVGTGLPGAGPGGSAGKLLSAVSVTDIGRVRRPLYLFVPRSCTKQSSPQYPFARS